MYRFVFAAAISLAGCGLTGAQDRAAQVRACAESKAPPAAVIAACDALLGMGDLSDKERAAGLFWRAEARIRSGDAAALQDLDALVELDPNEASAYGLRGVAHAVRGDTKAAVRDFDRALELDPKAVEALQNRGKVFSDGGDQMRAIADFDRAIELAPNNGIVRNGRCWSRAIIGKQLAEALDDCNAAIRLAPRDANNYNSRAFVRFRSGDYADAVSDYDIAIAMDSKMPSSYYMRGRAKAMLGDHTATQDLERGVAGEPGIAARYAGYGIPAL